MSFVDDPPLTGEAGPTGPGEPAEARPSGPDEPTGGQHATEDDAGERRLATGERPAAASQGSVKVRTEQFEGPFDLLLHLILKDEVDLYEINLATIVDAYLAELERMDLCDLEAATEFLLIAATLVELKCRRLLPVDDDIDLDEEFGLWEERDLLLSRLLECKTFKDAAKVFEQLAERAAASAPRRAGLEDRFLELTPDLLSGVKPDMLRRAFLRVATAKPEPTVDLFHVTAVKVSVSEAISNLAADLPARGPVTFRELTRGMVEKLEIVVHFLAVLELFKQGLVDLDQPASFGELTVEWVAEDTDVDEALAGADLYEG